MRPAGRALSPPEAVNRRVRASSNAWTMTCQPWPFGPVDRQGNFLGKWGPRAVDAGWTTGPALRTFKYMPAVSLTAVTVSLTAVTEAVVAQPHPLLPIPAYLERHLPDEVVGSVFGDDFHRELEHHVADQLDPDAVLADRLDRFLEQEVPAIDYCAGELLRPTNDVG